MKEYTIKINLLVESEMEYDRISEYAEELTEKLMNEEAFINEDIEIVGVNVDEIEDYNEDQVNDWFDEDDENF